MLDSIKTVPLGVVILAAGKGKRMNDPQMAKVMYTINEKPMLDYVVDLAGQLQAQRTIIVVGWQKQVIIDHFGGSDSGVEFVDQAEQLGTGHAVLQTAKALKDFSGDLLVLSGDVPLLSEKTVRALTGFHRASGAVATILTAEIDDPSGYGRIVRNPDGTVKKIVEHKDASKKELAITEINSGIYVFDKERLFESLAKIGRNNAQEEYYLTDVFEIFWEHNWKVAAVKALDPIEVMGINDAGQLESARSVMLGRTKD